MGALTFATDVLPAVMVIVIGVIVPIQAWMIKQIISLLRWQSMAEERCKQHSHRDKTLEQQVPITLKVLGDHGNEMESIRLATLNLEKRLVDGLSVIDKRLESIETKYDTAMSLFSLRTQISKKEPGL